MPHHDCKPDDLVHAHLDWTEPDGERCHQGWWECRVCGDKFTETEAAQLIVERRASPRD
jgi:hypothetical protein